VTRWVRCSLSDSDPFVCRCLTSWTMLPSSHPAHRTGQACFDNVLRVVFASTLGSVGSGILAGVALTLALNTILAKWAESDWRDPIILLAGTLLLSLVSGIACAIPPRHASEPRSYDGATLRVSAEAAVYATDSNQD